MANCIEAKAATNIPLDGLEIKQGERITVSMRESDCILWHPSGVYAMDKGYVGETINIVSNQ